MQWCRGVHPLPLSISLFSPHPLSISLSPPLSLLLPLSLFLLSSIHPKLHGFPSLKSWDFDWDRYERKYIPLLHTTPISCTLIINRLIQGVHLTITKGQRQSNPHLSKLNHVLGLSYTATNTQLVVYSVVQWHIKQLYIQSMSWNTYPRGIGLNTYADI